MNSLMRPSQNVNKDYKIIAVGDEEGILNPLSIFLKSSGYNFTGVTNPIDAIEKIRNEHFDLMILDFVITSFHCEHVVEEIRKIDKDLYILLLTETKDITLALETIRTLDIQGYCEKGEQFDKLLFHIESGMKSIAQMQEIREMNEKLSISNARLENSYLEIIETLRYTVEAKDSYTRGHSDRVSAYSVLIGENLELFDKDIRTLRIGGLFHDIGKIGIPDSILLKDSKLTGEEYSSIKRHPSIGAHILSSVSFFKDIIPIVKYHHERYDGNGYPEGLKGKNIPLLARITAIADSFDAMTSKRSYRSSLPLDIAISEIEQGKGTQFDPEIADVFLDILKNDIEKIEEIQEKYNTQIPETV